MSVPSTSNAPCPEQLSPDWQLSLGVHFWPVMNQKLANGETAMGMKVQFCLIKANSQRTVETSYGEDFLDEKTLNEPPEDGLNPYVEAVRTFIDEKNINEKDRLVAVTIVFATLPCIKHIIENGVRNMLAEKRIRNVLLRVSQESEFMIEEYIEEKELKCCAIVRTTDYFYVYCQHKSLARERSEGEVQLSLAPVAEKFEAVCAEIKNTADYCIDLVNRSIGYIPEEKAIVYETNRLLVVITGEVNEENIRVLKELPSVKELADRIDIEKRQEEARIQRKREKKEMKKNKVKKVKVEGEKQKPKEQEQELKNFDLKWKTQKSNLMRKSLAYTAAAAGAKKSGDFPTKFDFDFGLHL